MNSAFNFFEKTFIKILIICLIFGPIVKGQQKILRPGRNGENYMAAKVYCRKVKSLHTFYLVTDEGEFFLFNQAYRKGVHEYFSHGVHLDKALDHSKSRTDNALAKTKDKLPMYIKYVEKEYGISILNRAKSRKGHKKARDRFIEANMHLVVSYCKPYIDFGVSYEDLIQEGTIALMKAVDTYNPIRAIRFRNYAHSVIMHHVEKTLPDNLYALAIHCGRGQDMAKIFFTKNKLQKMNGEEPTADEIVKHCDAPKEMVENILAMTTTPLAFDELIDEDDDIYLEDDISSNEEDIDSCIERAYASQFVNEAFNKLSQREKIVIRMYYGLDGEEPMTHEEIGKIVGVTSSRVGAIKKEAISKMGGHKKAKKRRGKRKYLGPGYYN